MFPDGQWRSRWQLSTASSYVIPQKLYLPTPKFGSSVGFGVIVGAWDGGGVGFLLASHTLSIENSVRIFVSTG